MRTRGKVAAYSVLICAAIACLGAVVAVVTGPAGGLVYLGVVACLVPLGRVIWP